MVNKENFNNMTVDEAIKIAKKECNNEYAQAYLRSIPEAIELGGLSNEAEKSFKIQITYALSNMSYWKGSTARNVKKALKTYIH